MKAASTKQALINGVFWTIGLRYAVKGIGFISTAIMARLLAPADYGLVAMAMLVVGLIQAFLDLGTEVALLRKNEVTREEIDSAWTLHLMQSLVIGSLIALAAYPASLYFREPRVVPMVGVLGACVCIAGLQNIGLVLAHKALNFRIEFQHQVASKVVSAIVTVACGLWLRDYRALLIGIATGYLTGTALSYVLHRYRPRWDTSRISTIWATTKWLMLGNMGGYLLGKTDELSAARIGTTAEYGLYNVGADLGALPVTSIGPAIMQSLLPVLAKLENEAERTRHAVTKTVGALNTITLPMGLGFAALATPAALLVLGHQWDGAAQFMAIFAVCGSVRFLLNPLNALLVMKGHARLTTRNVWFEFACFGVVALLLVPQFGLMGLALGRLAGLALNTLLVAFEARRHCQVDLAVIGRALLRPLIGSLLMAALITWVIPHFTLPATQFAAGAAAGAALFIAWSFGTWALLGRPDGLETTVLQQLARRRAK